MWLGWHWGTSGLRVTGSWGALGNSRLRGTGNCGARVARVAREARVARMARVARGLIFLWFELNGFMA